MDRALTIGQVAERLSISTTTVREWAANGTLPPPRATGPKLLRWLESELDAWLASRPLASEAPGRNAITGAALAARRARAS